MPLPENEETWIFLEQIYKMQTEHKRLTHPVMLDDTGEIVIDYNAHHAYNSE